MFLAHHRVSSGEVQLAPWALEDLESLLRDRLLYALNEHDLRGAWLATYATSGLQLPLPKPVLLWALAAIIELSRGHLPPYPDFKVGPGEFSAACLLVWEDQPAWRPAVQILVFAATVSGFARDDDWLMLAKKSLDGTGLEALAEGCRKVTGRHPIAHLQIEAELAPPRPEMLEREINAARATLRERFKEWANAHAVGRRIPRTHCRQAWTKFIDTFRPCYQALIKADEPVESFHPHTLHSLYVSIADAGDAHHNDRNVMDNAAELLIDAAVVLQARLERRIDLAANSVHPDVFGRRLINHLQAPDNTKSPNFLTWLRQGIALQPSQPHPWRITVSDLSARPSLIEALERIDTGDNEWSIDLRSIKQPKRVALAWGDPPVEVEPVKEMNGLLDLLAAADRWAMIARIHPLPPAIHRQLEGRRALLNEQGSSLSAELYRLIGELDDLGHALSWKDLRSAVQDWRALLEKDPAEIWLGCEWLAQVVDWTQAIVQQSREELLSAAPLKIRESVRALLEEGELSEAVKRVDRQDWARPAPLRLREIPFKLPDDAMRWLKGSPALTPEATTLVKLWCELAERSMRAPSQIQQDHLLDAFIQWLFDVEQQQRKSAIHALKSARRVKLKSVRAWLKNDIEGPTFVPQLAHFRNLRIKMLEQASVRISARTLQSLHEAGDLVVVLVPGGRQQMRAAFVEAQRQAQTHAIAVLTDADLVRLLRSTGGQTPQPLLGLLELLFAQQAWLHFQPFDLGDGSEIKPEMFVGRTREIDALVSHGSYGRIFAGRKLGKSALLSSVCQRAKAIRLPSGRSLLALHINIGGLRDETSVVEAIAQALSAAIPKISLPAADEHPIKVLSALVDRVQHRNPDLSLLFLLDEADTFVEEQFKAYQRQANEEDLTWAMRNHLESARDDNGLPLARFVFCGYRKTWRAEAAFVNWRGLLQLEPLDLSDAELLIAGPLARLGIDARSVAPDISWRCGRQPALLHDFGLCLLEYLARRVPVAKREGYIVTPADVSVVARNERFRDHVRTVCWLNFVGSPRAELVFATFLLELANSAVGVALDDLPQRLLRRLGYGLRQPIKEPESLFYGAWDEAVNQELRTLVSRKLLIEDTQSGGYRLAFALHLPILLEQDIEQRIHGVRERLINIEESMPSWVLGPEELDSLEIALGDEGGELGVEEVVIGSHWTAPLLDPQRGLSARMNLALRRTERGFEYQADTLRLLRITGAAGLRRAIARGSEVERIALHRLTIAQLLGWFVGVRTVEFAEANPWRPIFKATAGIPLLVETLDRLIIEVHGESSVVGEADLRQLLNVLRQRHSILAQALAGEAPEIALSAHERQLLRLVVAASDLKEIGEWDVGFWRECLAAEEMLEEVGLKEYRPLTAEDEPALNLLFELGLLPVDPSAPSSLPRDRLMPLSHDDALRALVELMPI